MTKSAQQLSGQELVALFRDALIARSTTHYADTEAAQSERQTINFLETVSSGAILNPSTIPEDTQANITRASVDAHIKKVQAEQIREQSSWQMADLPTAANQYIGKKVRITVLDKATKPIDSIWYQQQTGYTTNTVSTKGISGKIHEILLEKNALVLRPGTFSKFINPQRHYFVVYVMNPENVAPFIEISL